MKTLPCYITFLLLYVNSFASTCECLSLYFDKELASLSSEAKQQLQLPNLSLVEMVWIYGHTDTDGSTAYNLALAKARIDAVKNLLPNYPIETIAYGESEPLNANLTEEEKALNRRVEVCYLLKGNFLPQISSLPTQRFEIKPDLDTMLLGAQGTQLYLTKEIFNADITKPVVIELIEFYDKADMVLANVSSLTAKQKILETAGMHYINARQEDKNIQLKNGSSYFLEFKEKPEGYALYTGDTLQQTIQWTLEKDTLIAFQIAEKEAEFPGGLENFYTFFRKNLQYPKAAQRNGISETVFIEFIIDTTGQLHSPKVIQGIGFGCDEEALRVIRLSPNWIPARNRGKSVSIRQTLPINFTLNGNDSNKFIVQGITPLEGTLSAKIQEAVFSSIPKSALQSSSLGWKNLDKLFLYNKPTTLTIKALPDAYLSLVYQNLPIIHGGFTYHKDGYQFNQIPQNQAIKIIAWKPLDSNILLSITDASTSEGQITNLTFTEVSVEKAVQLIRQESKSVQ